MTGPTALTEVGSRTAEEKSRRPGERGPAISAAATSPTSKTTGRVIRICGLGGRESPPISTSESGRARLQGSPLGSGVAFSPCTKTSDVIAPALAGGKMVRGLRLLS